MNHLRSLPVQFIALSCLVQPACSSSRTEAEPSDVDAAPRDAGSASNSDAATVEPSSPNPTDASDTSADESNLSTSADNTISDASVETIAPDTALSTTSETIASGSDDPTSSSDTHSTDNMDPDDTTTGESNTGSSLNSATSESNSATLTSTTSAESTTPSSEGSSTEDTTGGEASTTETTNDALDAGSGEPLLDAAPATVAPTISNLALEANPNNNLSVWVSWSTDVPATSEVRFGQGDFAFKVASDELTTQHRLLVVGMHANSDYRLAAFSANVIGETTQEDTYQTGSLPAGVAVPTLTVDTGGKLPGWTVTNIQRVVSGTPATVVMYDQLGAPVWYHVIGTASDTRGDIVADPLPNGNVLIGPTANYPAREVDIAGNIVWLGPEQPTSDGRRSHHVSKLSNGNYILLRDLRRNGAAGALIEEFTPDNEVVWSWDLQDHHPAPDDAPTDWCHANSVTIDEENDVLYLSCRWLGVFKANRYGDQSIIWHMGASEGGETGDVEYDPSDTALTDQHDPEIHADGTIMIYNNGGYASGQYNSNFHTRVLEFNINDEDPEHVVAERVWEFPGEFAVDDWYTDDWYTPYWGDANRLSNNNVLVAAGMRLSGYKSRIFEVESATGQVVWELEFPERHGIYRARYVDPPWIEALPVSNSDAGIETEAGVDAGQLDASPAPLDAGIASDASVDAGSPDASPAVLDSGTISDAASD